MSKKKNTLKDLDEFLKQQASTLVAPAQLGDTIEQAKPEADTSVESNIGEIEITQSKILDDLKKLSEKEGASFRKVFYDLIIQSIEKQKSSSAEDKILINTALYLKSGDQWKEAIRSYWKEKSQ